MKITRKNHKFVSVLSILAILFTLMPVSAFAAESMEDISGHWAENQIQDWVDSGHIKGYPDGSFKPDNNITRAEFMTIANNAFGYTEKEEISYSDVADGSWYADAVAIAKAAGYITGYPDGTMKPNAPISRQEAAVMVAKINELESDEAAAGTFTDGANIASWSKGLIGACVTAEILTGYPDGSFKAENPIKRGESVVTLSRALDYTNTAPTPVTADEVNTAIAALPVTEELTLDDQDAVAEAKLMLEALTAEQAALVTDENKAKLAAAIVKIAELADAAGQEEGQDESDQEEGQDESDQEEGQDESGQTAAGQDESDQTAPDQDNSDQTA